MRTINNSGIKEHQLKNHYKSLELNDLQNRFQQLTFGMAPALVRCEVKGRRSESERLFQHTLSRHWGMTPWLTSH